MVQLEVQVRGSGLGARQRVGCADGCARLGARGWVRAVGCARLGARGWVRAAGRVVSWRTVLQWYTQCRFCRRRRHREGPTHRSPPTTAPRVPSNTVKQPRNGDWTCACGLASAPTEILTAASLAIDKPTAASIP